MTPTSRCVPLIAALALCASAGAWAANKVVFSTTFENGLSAKISPGVATIEGAQGFAGLGTGGARQFKGSFLRSPTGNTVTLTLNALPAHQYLSMDFLFAAIDSLDGTGNFPSGDFFSVTVDGQTIFRESFANALPDQIQSYIPSPGNELARHIELGFSVGGFYTDSAYALGGEPAFRNIPHTAASAVITFLMEGPGIQDLTDESWAIDRLRVAVHDAPR